MSVTSFSLKDNKEEEFAKYEDRWREFWEYMNESLTNEVFDEMEYKKENGKDREETTEEKFKRLEEIMTEEAFDFFEWKSALSNMNKSVAEYFLRRTSKFKTVTEEDKHSKTMWENSIRRAIALLWN